MFCTFVFAVVLLK